MQLRRFPLFVLFLGRFISFEIIAFLRPDLTQLEESNDETFLIFVFFSSSFFFIRTAHNYFKF